MLDVMLTVDESTKEYISYMPKRLSASRVLRYIITAMFTTDAEFEVYKKRPEVAEVRAFVRSKLRGRI